MPNGGARADALVAQRLAHASVAVALVALLERLLDGFEQPLLLG